MQLTLRPHAALFPLGIALVVVPAIAFAASPIPPAAQKAITAVHKAAAKRDFSALQALMIEEFTWSFGGDASAQQAIDAWRSQPSKLTTLRRVTGQRCERISQQYVECPRNAGISFRAGFTVTPHGWRMAYFVAGD